VPTQAYTNSYSRVWFQEGGPGPSRARTYQGDWKAGSASWGRGDLTVIRQPDPDVYGQFIRVGRYRGEPSDPELPITARYPLQRSKLLRVARGDCEHSLQIHMGQCENPQDFARGWQKAIILEGAAIRTWGTQDLGALGPNENAPVNEDVPFVGTDLYEVVRMTFSEQTPTLVSREMTSVYVCDNQQCAACGLASDGCQVVIALEGTVAASPGQAPTVIYTRDGGATWAERPVSSLAANQIGNFIICAGAYAIVGSADAGNLNWILLSDLVTGAGSWTGVTTGQTTTTGVLAAWSLGATENWFSGEAGFVYFSDDPTNGVVAKHSGSVTTQDLNDIHAFDSNNIVAVGASNAVIRSTNAGVSWSLVTGPAVGVVLNAVWMRSANEWFVGAANGNLYYTLDAGVTWTQKRFSGDGAGQVRDIVFATPSVGYMAHSTATPAGRIFRTIDGGYSWYLMPEGTGSIPTNSYVRSLAVCDDPNVVFGAGLGTGVDGFLVKGA